MEFLLQGQRQKKLEARNLREQKEEQERRAIDIEEAQFQAQKRREAIERAKTQQYYQTDRVKGFHVSATLYIWVDVAYIGRTLKEWAIT